MVTHDQEEALTMSDRIVVMSKGRIEQVGTPDEIYARPATPFVADFIGKMNFLPGRLLSADRAEVQGAMLSFDRAHRLEPGAPVTVCIRPEDVVVRGVGDGRRNGWRGPVGVMEFIGNHFATTLHVAGHEAERVGRPLDQRRPRPRHRAGRGRSDRAAARAAARLRATAARL